MLLFAAANKVVGSHLSIRLSSCTVTAPAKHSGGNGCFQLMFEGLRLAVVKGESIINCLLVFFAAAAPEIMPCILSPSPPHLPKCE